MSTQATPTPTGAVPRTVRGIADWHGHFRDGDGTISTAGATLQRVPYTYASRFEGAPGACPEELLAAAHAACFNHALANIAGIHGVEISDIETSAEVTMGRDDTGPAILGLHLSVLATSQHASDAELHELAQRALVGCALSKALSIRPTLTANLVRPATQ